MRQLRVLLLPPPVDGMLVHRRINRDQQYVAGAHLYTWVKSDDVGKVSRLAGTGRRATHLQI